MNGDGRRGQDRGQGHDRAAPSLPDEEPAGERHEDRAGEAGADGQDRQRAMAMADEPGGDDREGGLVEDRGHGQAEARPHQVEARERFHARPGDEQERGRQRSRGHERARAVRVQPMADRDGRDPADEQRERERARDLGPRPAELDLHRADEDRERVVHDAPGDGLGEREAGQHRPAVVQAAAGRRRLPSPRSSRNRRDAGRPGDRLSATGTASLGPPQQDRGLRRCPSSEPVLHTPVSGSTSLTSRAPCSSPVRRTHDRAHLLVSRQHQERRGAAVALHAHDVEVLLRAGGAARRRGAAPCRSCAHWGR